MKIEYTISPYMFIKDRVYIQGRKPHMASFASMLRLLRILKTVPRTFKFYTMSGKDKWFAWTVNK